MSFGLKSRVCLLSEEKGSFEKDIDSFRLVDFVLMEGGSWMCRERSFIRLDWSIKA